MKMTGNGYTTTTSKRYGYQIVKIVHKGEPNKYWIYKLATETEPEQFMKERFSYEDAVRWCKLYRIDGKKNEWEK